MTEFAKKQAGFAACLFFGQEEGNLRCLVERMMEH